MYTSFARLSYATIINRQINFECVLNTFQITYNCYETNDIIKTTTTTTKNACTNYIHDIRFVHLTVGHHHQQQCSFEYNTRNYAGFGYGLYDVRVCLHNMYNVHIYTISVPHIKSAHLIVFIAQQM